MIPPQSKYGILSGVLSRNRLYVRNSAYQVALADTNLNLLSPPLPYNSIQSIVLKNMEYLIVETRQKRKHYPAPESAAFISDTTKAVKKEELIIMSGSSFYRNLPQYVKKLTDSRGSVLKGFESYDFLNVVDSNGNWVHNWQYFKDRGLPFLVRDIRKLVLNMRHSAF